MATEQQVNTYRTELNNKAQEIYDNLILLQSFEAALENTESELEGMTAAFMSDIANERFEINNKLRYTNDDQRKAALIEAQQQSADYQIILADRRAGIQNAVGKKAIIEQTRKEFRAQELVLLWYANNPA